MNMFRRALAVVAISGTALSGVAVAGVSAAQASSRVSTHLSIKAPHRVTYGATATVTGKLNYAGHPHMVVANETVTLKERNSPTSKWTVVGTGVTATDGTVSITTAAMTRKEQVRLVFAGDAAASPRLRRTVSEIRTIKVAYSVTTAVAGSTVTVTVAPAAKHRVVRLQRLRNHYWHTIRHTRLDASGTTATFTITKPGTYRVVKAASHRYLRGVSAAFTM